MSLLGKLSFSVYIEMTNLPLQVKICLFDLMKRLTCMHLYFNKNVLRIILIFSYICNLALYHKTYNEDNYKVAYLVICLYLNILNVLFYTLQRLPGVL